MDNQCTNIFFTHATVYGSHSVKLAYIEEITIKFGTKLKPTKASWKSQLYLYYDLYYYEYFQKGVKCLDNKVLGYNLLIRPRV